LISERAYLQEQTLIKRDKSHWLHLALFSVSALYAGNFTFAKWAMPEYIGAFGFILVRVLAGAIIFGLYYFIFDFEKIKERRHYLQLAIAAFFGVSLNMLAFFKGLSLTSSVNAAVLMLFAPVFVVVFMAIDKQTKILKTTIAGVLLAFAGAAMLMGAEKFTMGFGNMKGDLLIILNACSYGFYLYYVGRLLAIYRASTLVAYIFMFGLVFVIPVGLPELLEVQWKQMPNDAAFAILYAVVGITFLAYFLNSWAIQKSSGALVGAYVYLQPVLAALITVIIGDEVLSLEKTIFAALIITGVYLVNKSR
jgi:drug/metabolite transporter (DMT)-like permease